MNRSDKPAENESNKVNTYIPPCEIGKEIYAVKHTFFRHNLKKQRLCQLKTGLVFQF